MLQVLLSLAMVQLCEPRAKEEKVASDIAVVFFATSSICQEEVASLYLIMLVSMPRSSTWPDPFLFLEEKVLK